MNMFRRAFSTAAATTTPAARPCIMAGVILKRNPIVVRDPTSFEKAYADYRRESIHQASAPYNADYFEAELRNSPSKTSKDKSSASNSGSAEDSSVRYMERKGDDSDRTRLDRLMTRSLYLVTRQQNSPTGKWTFPQGIVEAEESLVEVRGAH
jgi:hypothetical protein